MSIRSLVSTSIIASFLTLAAGEASADVLLLQDSDPCGDSSTADILSSWDVTYDIVSSDAIPLAKRLQNYDTIIVSSHQPSSFYPRLAEAMPRITRWLKGGYRTLEFHGASGCAEVDYDLVLPRGVVPTGPYWHYDSNTVRLRNNPLVAGIPAKIGPYESMWVTDHFFSERGKSIVVDAEGRPTLMDYCVGDTGRVIATGLSVERFYSDNLDSAALLPNMLNASVYTPGCQNTPPAM